MTQEEKVAILRANRWYTDKPRGDNKGKYTTEQLKRYAQDVIDNANRRIRTAAKQETKAQRAAYQSRSMERLRTKGDKYYLPKGRFSQQGVKNEKTRRDILKNAAGFLGLKTPKASFNREQSQRLKRELTRTGISRAAKDVEDAAPIIGTAGAAAGRRIVGKPRREFFTTDEEYSQAMTEWDIKQELIEDQTQATVDKINAMTYEQTRDFYAAYRKFLETVWGQASYFERKFYRDYDSIENSAGAIINQLLDRGLDVDAIASGNWVDALSAAKIRIRVADAVGKPGPGDLTSEKAAEAAFLQSKKRRRRR